MIWEKTHRSDRSDRRSPSSPTRGSDVSTSKKRFESGSDAKSARPSRRVVAED